MVRKEEEFCEVEVELEFPLLWERKEVKKVEFLLEWEQKEVVVEESDVSWEEFWEVPRLEEEGERRKKGVDFEIERSHRRRGKGKEVWAHRNSPWSSSSSPQT